MITETCPDCSATVALCDNNVRLDLPAEPHSGEPDGPCWTIMSLGGMHLAAVGGPGTGGLGHRLHDHQPPEMD